MIEKEVLGGWLVGLIVLGVVIGCGDSSTGKNHREGIPALYSEDFKFNTYWIGKLGIEDLMVVGTNPTHDTSLSAKFTDFTKYTVTVATRDYYPTTCYIYTSLPEPAETKQPLNVNSVTVKGLKDGDHALNANGDTVFLPDRAFTDSQVSFTVLSGTDASDFPGFEDQINAPAFPKLLRLGNLSSPDLSTAPSLGITTERADPLIVEWEASSADYFEFILVPQNGTDIGYGKLRCIAYDDGYLEVPPDAIQALALDTYTNFRVLIERHNFKSHLIMDVDGKTTKAAALIDVSSTLEATVLK